MSTFALTTTAMANFQISVDEQEVQCMPWKYSLSYPLWGAIESGDFVEFRAAQNVFFGKSPGILVGKQIRGVPGDHIEVKNTILRINHKFAGVLEKPVIAKLNSDIDKFQTSYTLGPNQYFVMGLLPRSFDSRYWGPIDGNLITHRSVGLF